MRPSGTEPLPDLSVERVQLRRTLLEQFDQGRARVEATERTTAHDRFRRQAFALLSSGRMRQALDIGREPLRLRERYGMTLFGQSCLAARRVLEAGGTFVTVFWDEYGLFNTGWDTHVHHFPRLRDELGPGFDMAFSGLVTDLEARGMLDDTLVVWTTEFGRTPFTDGPTGRSHQASVFSSWLAGGGVKGGIAYGRSDDYGAKVAENEVHVHDFHATILHLLGFDHKKLTFRHAGRDFRLTDVHGNVVKDILA